MDPHTAEAFAWAVSIFAGWVVFVVGMYLLIIRSPRKAAASYDDEGVHGDVVIVPRRGAAHD